MRDANSDRIGPTVLYSLHFLGGSARSWDMFAEHLGAAVVHRPIDLPGFGDAAGIGPRDVAAMADHVEAIVRRDRPARWLIVGHSMGAKVATVLARRAEDGSAGLGGLAGLVLVAGSPPSPEPMAEERRREMLGWFGGSDAANRRDASRFIGMNVGSPLPEVDHAKAVDDVLRMDREAWCAWLERGSREDLSGVVGRLATPALVVAGSEDEDLGHEAQMRLMAPHLTTIALHSLDGAGHLIPHERPADLAALILSHVATHAGEGFDLPDLAYRRLIASDRVSARTRRVLLARARPDEAAAAPTLAPDLFDILRAVVGRVVPQRSSFTIDLAARLDRALAERESDGWRFADLPRDDVAWREALAAVEAGARTRKNAGFASLDAPDQDALLDDVARGAFAVPGARLSAAQLKLWFEDLRAAAVRAYVAHPATLGRMGYSGIANGGDGPRKQGFVDLRAGHPEPWEPRGVAAGERP